MVGLRAIESATVGLRQPSPANEQTTKRTTRGPLALLRICFTADGHIHSGTEPDGGADAQLELIEAL
jgi:hypothetical protein